MDVSSSPPIRGPWSEPCGRLVDVHVRPMRDDGGAHAEAGPSGVASVPNEPVGPVQACVSDVPRQARSAQAGSRAMSRYALGGRAPTAPIVWRREERLASVKRCLALRRHDPATKATMVLFCLDNCGRSLWSLSQEIGIDFHDLSRVLEELDVHRCHWKSAQQPNAGITDTPWHRDPVCMRIIEKNPRAKGGATMDTIANAYGVSRQAVDQAIKRAEKKIRRLRHLVDLPEPRWTTWDEIQARAPGKIGKSPKCPFLPLAKANPPAYTMRARRGAR
jgi:hypothetical protein